MLKQNWHYKCGVMPQAHQIDNSVTTKFAYIDWTPDTLGPMRKALLTTHKGHHL